MTTIKVRNNATKATIHSLPCKIEHTGKCDVSDYFIVQEPMAPIENECGINGSELTSLDQNIYLKPVPTVYFRGRRLFHSTIDWGNRQDNTEKNDMNKNGKNCNNENDSKSDSVSNVNSCNDNSNDNNNSNSSNGDSDLNTKFNTIGLNCNDNSRNSGSNNNNSNNKDKVKMGYYLEKGYSNNGKGIWITSKNFKKINVWSLATKDRSLYKSTINDWFNISNAIHEPIENYNNSKQLKQQSQSEKE